MQNKMLKKKNIYFNEKLFISLSKLQLKKKAVINHSFLSQELSFLEHIAYQDSHSSECVFSPNLGYFFCCI